MTEFSKEEQNTFYNSRPGKSIGATAILRDESGRILIAKASYKKGWTLIGGTTDQNESPLDAVIREVHEEVGVVLEVSQLKVAGYRYVTARDGRAEDSQIYFEAELNAEQIAGIKLQELELSEYRFVTKVDLHEYADTPRIQAIIAALGGPLPFYIQNEDRIL